MIYKQMAKILKEIKPITKDRQTQEGARYKYRGIDDVINEAHSIFAEHEVIPCPNVLDCHVEERTSKNGNAIIWTRVDVEYTFFASDGSSIKSKVRGEAMDTSDKGTNKAMSQAFKYCLMQMLMIPTEGSGDIEPSNHEIEPKKGKPLLTKKHKHYQKIIEKLVAKEITLSQVDEEFLVEPSIKNELLEASKL